MARLSINNEQYSKENEMLAEMGHSLGWTVDDSKLYHQGLMFKKRNTLIWKCKCVRFYDKPLTPIIWQVADEINGTMCNHRPYSEHDLEKALTEN